MAVALVNSSQTGTSDTFGTSAVVPVPASAAANHIALVHLEQWESGNPTVTPPDGNWTALTPLVSGSQKSKVFWKRLTGADSGNYTFTWTGSQWSMAHCLLISGAVTTGSPIEDSDTGTATSTNIPSLSVDTATEPFLAHFVANENAATGLPPTNYIEARDGDYVKANYRIPGSTGNHTSPGGTVSTSTLLLVQLIAIKADAGGGGTQTVVCNLLAVSSTVFSPEVEQVTALLAISAPSTLFNPAVAPGSVTVQPPLIVASSTVFSPLTVSDAVSPVLITTPSTLFNPGVINLLQLISLVLLQASSVVYNPVVSGGGTVEMPGTISDTARINMLADRVLTEPQLLSNVDLMKLILDDGAQTLVVKTDATAAVHLWRYLRTVRDS